MIVYEHTKKVALKRLLLGAVSTLKLALETLNYDGPTMNLFWADFITWMV